jgi:hypothetical protein
MTMKSYSVVWSCRVEVNTFVATPSLNAVAIANVAKRD